MAEKIRKTIAMELEEIYEQMCDKYCRYSIQCKDADDLVELFKFCETCPLGRLI